MLPLNSDVPLHTRAQKETNGITLFLSSAISPPYDFSTNLLPDRADTPGHKAKEVAVAFAYGQRLRSRGLGDSAFLLAEAPAVGRG